jgi:hypothetical protein
MTGLRRVVYTISALAVACFFLFPEPDIAIIGALLLQTLAFVIIAGQSKADSIVLAGITVLLMGLIPADHPLIRGPFFESAKPWLVGIGMAVIVSGLLLIGRRYRNRH